jgi:hypothetical protein
VSENKEHALSDDMSGLLGQYGYQSEAKIADCVESFLLRHHLEAQLSRNETLHGFEADIVVRLKEGGAGGLVRLVNIEVDGPMHQFPKKKLFTERRDGFLIGQFGYQICRVDITKFNKFEQDMEMESAVCALLEEVIFNT